MASLHASRVHVHSELCRDCQACALACSLYHENECSLELARLRIAKDMATYTFDVRLCQHCETPDCLAACPAEAIRLDDQGVALIDDDLCLRCGNCPSACPHGALFYNAARDRYLKCDLCAGRPEGQICVEVCPVGALTLGK